ncbi:hypothetical protein O7623_22490 [Solwaraspora sp. WMMD791]|uniref:hypothetical protein n=1 Tax=Solwaraspora sp. WMMD791 TaxID=3016086 RepID=UPI00249A61DE|nr:hypothetical protein [Solwaraspora sp. WMMD791]WFE26104.1 hypothetical protein O7623_22490 [Solwaraspora sp. WMMD791]
MPGARLRVPWTEVGAFDALMSNWQRIGDSSLNDIEEACVEEIFLLLIAPDVAELLWSPVSCATDIHDRSRLGEIISGPIDDILATAEWFDHDGRTILSPAGTLYLVEAACRAHATQVLDLVIEQEAESRHSASSAARTPPVGAGTTGPRHRNGSTTGTAAMSGPGTNCYASGAATGQSPTMNGSSLPRPRLTASTSW